MIDAAPTTVAPAARATSIVSRVDPPVVTTSSTTSTRSPGASVKPRRSVSAPSCRSAKIARTPSARADLLADDDAAERRREHDLSAQIADPLGDGRAAGLGLARVLQHERALQVAWAVQAGGQPEVPFEQGADAPEEIEHGIGGDERHRRPSIPFATSRTSGRRPFVLQRPANSLVRLQPEH